MPANVLSNPFRVREKRWGSAPRVTLSPTLGCYIKPFQGTRTRRNLHPILGLFVTIFHHPGVGVPLSWIKRALDALKKEGIVGFQGDKRWRRYSLAE